MENKYELIIKYIEKLATSNELKQGDRLPPIRLLALNFKCSIATVIRAYTELEMNHKIYSIPRSGYYLVEKNNLKDHEYNTLDFSEVAPEPRLLPYKEFNHCINKAIELYKSDLFSYGDAQGLESLRKVLVNHFSEHQVFTSEKNIFITSGAQQALSILSRMAFPNGKKNILVEQPTYALMQRLVELNGDKLIGINRNYDGIDLQELERLFKYEDIKFFYTIPRFHNPLGTSFSEKDKKKIAKLAEKYDVYIVEDDYLVDINIDKSVLPIYYYDIAQRVIYVKSFSKTFMPGIRIGSVVLHEKLIGEFLKHKRCYDLSTSVLEQGALEIFINTGMYRNHVKKAQLQYKKKVNCLRQCLASLNTEGIEIFVPEIGFFVWIKLPKRININILVQRLKDKDIYISPAKYFFIGNNSKENSFRICISKLSENEIRNGIGMIFEEIKEMK
jgi:DNA-binding transcriptional MocR family regulator